MGGGESRRRTWIGIGVLLGVMLAALAGLALLVGGLAGGGGSATDARSAARTYLDAWERKDFSKLASMVERPSREVQTTYRAQWRDLRIRSARFRVSEVTTPATGTTATVTTAKFHARLRLAKVGRVEYDGQLALLRRGDAWRVAWTPAAVHPSLAAG